MANQTLTKNVRFFKAYQDIRSRNIESKKQLDELIGLVKTLINLNVFTEEQQRRIFTKVNILIALHVIEEKQAIKEEVAHNNPYLRQR